MSNPTPIERRPASLVELPLLPQQDRWLTLETRYPGATTPLVQLIQRVRGPLEVDAWLRAFRMLVDRHEILHTHFKSTVEGMVQVVGPADGHLVELVDEAGLAEPERARRARAVLLERQRRPFDLTEGPLMTAHLVRFAEDDHLWALLIHHSLADGVSAAIIDNELRLCYQAFVAGTEPELPALPIQSGDYAVWRAATHRARDDEFARRYWVKHLSGVPPLELRTDHPRPREKGAPAADVRHVVGGDIARRIEELAGAARCTRFMVVLAAVQALLAELSGQHDFCVAIPVGGAERGQPELANLVGPFNNLLPLRCDLSGDPTFATLLTRIRAALLDGLSYQDLPFGELLDALELPLDPSRTQLCQVLFGFDELTDAEVAVPGLTIEEFPPPLGHIPYDLMIYARLDDDGLSLQFYYDTGLFTEDTVLGMAGTLERILRGGLGRPDASW